MGFCPKHWVALVTLQPRLEKTFSQPCGLETRTLMILACIKAPKAFIRPTPAPPCRSPAIQRVFLSSHPHWLLTNCTHLLSGGLACALEGCFLFVWGLQTRSGLGELTNFSAVSALSSSRSEPQTWGGGPFQVDLS